MRIGENWGGSEEDLARGLAVRDSIWVTDLNGAVGRDGAKESANNSLGLVRASYVAITDVEDDQRVNPRRQARRGRCKLQHSVLVRRHDMLGIGTGSVGYRESVWSAAQLGLGFSRRERCMDFLFDYNWLARALLQRALDLSISRGWAETNRPLRD